MMKIFSWLFVLLGVFGVFGSNSNSNSIDSMIKKLKDEERNNEDNFDAGLFNKDASISALETCYDSYDCSGESITDANVVCDGYYACQGSTISFSNYVSLGGRFAGYYGTITASSDSGWAVCNGEFSCNTATLTTNNGIIECFGSSSCYGSSLTTDGTLSCTGYNTCKYSDIITSTTICQGEDSCLGSNIKATTLLYVSGANCANSDTNYQSAYISDTPYIYDTGENSFNGAIIYTNGTSPLIIESYGYYSTSNATILCYGSSKCRLRCYGDESCSYTKFYCENSADCRTRCGNCASCPSITYVDSIDDVFDTSLLLTDNINIDNKNNKKYDLDIAPVIRENNVRLNNGISSEKKNFLSKFNINSLTDSTLVLIIFLCFGVYEIGRKVLFYCFSRSKKDEYQEIDDGSFRYTRDEMAVVL